ncbi:uncharacterized protein (DUF885 family) [Novosphingobium chloroacetimidivorans]|uniref:Uncharacterized protein (DUF885 family) n=1 Tax=Novosphingobium chloroacetimidivorans TaxID=1428314 RepID=A0A7W7KAR7_9SPHN|nr:DUF885 family protein [Novosphingobium chloroacetimidivorans]MBB4859360.1 uncharacterized protein (DUF885 family) [Novosphingobium chloroacetimidivorans]
MTSTVICMLGISGGIGGSVATALLRHGFLLRALVRDPAALSPQWAERHNVELVPGNAMNAADVAAAAVGCSAIFHGVNPAGYRDWDKLVLPMIDNTIAAARAAGGARVVLPGTIYNFDPIATPLLDEHSPQRPKGEKGNIRRGLERRLEDAAGTGVPTLMDAYIARIGGIARAQSQLVEIAKRNAAAGSRVPRFAYEAMSRQSRALSAGAPFAGPGTNVVWTDAQAKIEGLLKSGKIDRARAAAYKTAAHEALIAHWGPAYAEQAAWFEAEVPRADVVATGVGKNPNGKAYYEMALASGTTTRLTPDEVHRIGLAEVARIKVEMETIKTQVGFEGSLPEFFRYVRDTARFYYPNTDAGRQAYIDAATAHVDFMKQQVPRFFGTLPKADVVVKRVEGYREIPGAPQHYFLSTPDGSRPGVYYLHLSDMRAMPIPQLEVISYHEALPGHHMNFAIAQEMTGVPEFRKFLDINAYQEGWGLYTEKLGKEMGGYRDPYSDFGRLSTEIWRAIRLVLDAGLHAKGWTEEQAVAYYRDNSPAAEGQIRAEVQRYIVWPGQAAGYKIGMLKIEELRKRAESELGERFDLKEFHDTILGGGQMPLPLLERRVGEWIETRKHG